MLCASEVGSPTNHLSSGQRRDTGQGPFRNLIGQETKPGHIIDACTNHTVDGIHSDHGYLDNLDNPMGPP